MASRDNNQNGSDKPARQIKKMKEEEKDGQIQAEVARLRTEADQLRREAIRLDAKADRLELSQRSRWRKRKIAKFEDELARRAKRQKQ